MNFVKNYQICMYIISIIKFLKKLWVQFLPISILLRGTSEQSTMNLKSPFILQFFLNKEMNLRYLNQTFQCLSARSCIYRPPFYYIYRPSPFATCIFWVTDHKHVIEEQVQYTFLQNSSAKNLQSALYTPVFRDVGVLGTN